MLCVFIAVVGINLPCALGSASLGATAILCFVLTDKPNSLCVVLIMKIKFSNSSKAAAKNLF